MRIVRSKNNYSDLLDTKEVSIKYLQSNPDLINTLVNRLVRLAKEINPADSITVNSVIMFLNLIKSKNLSSENDSLILDHLDSFKQAKEYLQSCNTFFKCNSLEICIKLLNCSINNYRNVIKLSN